MATLQLIDGGDNFILEKVDYSAADARGVAVTVVISWFSGMAVVGLLGSLGVSAWNTRKSVNPHLFVRSHVAAYFICALWADLLQAFGSVLNIHWLESGAVTYGGFCTYQGFVKQSADVSMAIWTFVMALHTFLVIFLRWNMPRWSMWGMLAGGWGLALLIVIIGPAGYKAADGPFYGIAGYWCWISSNYGTEHVTLDYMWLFLSAGLSFVLYALVYLNLRGNVTTRGVYLRRDAITKRSIDNESIAIAKQMLIYPVAYTILILPIAIVRFIEWSGTAVPDAASAFSDAVFLLSGLVDVVLFVITRRVLPEHSVLPRSVSLNSITRKLSRRSQQAKRPGLVANESFRAPDLEKGTVEKVDADGNPIHVVLSDGAFKRSDSPDSEASSSGDHGVTIRVQSVVVDRIYLNPADGHTDSQTPPGLPASAGLQSVTLDSAKAIREKSRDSEYYAKDLPPLPNSAYTPRGTVRGADWDARQTYAPEPPLIVRSPTSDLYPEASIPIPPSARGSRSPAYPETFVPIPPSARSILHEHYEEDDHISTPRDRYYSQESPVTPRGQYWPEEQSNESPLPSSKLLRSAEDAERFHSRRSMSDDTRPGSYYVGPSPEAPRSLLLNTSVEHHHHEERSPSEGSCYSSEGHENSPIRSPIHSPHTAPLPVHLGTPRSATFPVPPAPASARYPNFQRSARAQLPNGNWL